MRHATNPDSTAVLELTAAGKRQLTEPGTKLLPRQLEALVMIDGWLTVEQIAKYLFWDTYEELGTILRSLLDFGLVRPVSAVEEAGFDPGSFFDTLTVVNTSPEASDRDQKAALTGARLLQRNGKGF